MAGSSADRAFVWLVTGPVGRVVAFWLDLGAALWRWVANKVSPG
jgi:hypothetical protein